MTKATERDADHHAARRTICATLAPIGRRGEHDPNRYAVAILADLARAGFAVVPTPDATDPETDARRL